MSEETQEATAVDFFTKTAALLRDGDSMTVTIAKNDQGVAVSTSYRYGDGEDDLLRPIIMTGETNLIDDKFLESVQPVAEKVHALHIQATDAMDDAKEVQEVPAPAKEITPKKTKKALKEEAESVLTEATKLLDDAKYSEAIVKYQEVKAFDVFGLTSKQGKLIEAGITTSNQWIKMRAMQAKDPKEDIEKEDSVIATIDPDKMPEGETIQGPVDEPVAETALAPAPDFGDTETTDDDMSIFDLPDEEELPI